MDTDENIAIRVEHLSKNFKLPHQKHSSIKGVLLNSFRRKSYEIQHVLKGVNFDIKKGEFFGIVGRNGSGKSTLLKVIAGIYSPDSGSVTVNGSLTPFIELGVGFNPELSGRENVYLNGSLLGLSRKEIDGMYEDIVDFAELRRFMDQKLKNYSSGMQVRLAFSISIRAHTDILLLDEVLAVGDSAFQKKCFNYFEKLKANNATVVLVSHNMEAVERFCTRAVLVDAGKLIKSGSPSKIAQLYSDINTLSEINKKQDLSEPRATVLKQGFTSLSLRLQDKKGRQINTIRPGTDLIASIRMKSEENIDNAALGIIIFNSRNIPVFAHNTKTEDLRLDLKKGKEFRLTYTIQNIFGNDSYRIKVGLKDIGGTTTYFVQDDIAEFASIGRRHTYAVVSPEYKLEKR
jgi:ABC-2 type transport system ATP-binding protein